ncbi:hypothetical protein P9112_002188 [Eukaryota sp. TZLM1-RC]
MAFVSQARGRLLKEYKQMTVNPPENITAGPISEDNFFKWQFSLLGPPGSLYESGYFSGIIDFPRDYPFSPPKLKFTTPILHPNVYPTGEVCMSILHNQVDPSGYEKATEQWTPGSSVATILVSLLSLLSDPAFDSPANPDAAVMYRNNPTEYIKVVQQCVRQSLGL